MHTPASPSPGTALLALMAAVWLAGCGGNAKDAAATSADTARAAVAVRVATVTTETVAAPVVATGVVAPRDEIALGFKIPGVIARVMAREGDAVRAGQPLAALDLREIDAQVAKARSGLAKAERDLARVRALHRDSVATLSQLEDAATGAEVARAELEAASVNREYASIVAPASGRILRRAAEPGEQVSPGTPVLVLGSAAGGTVLRAGLADRDVVRLRQGDRAQVTFDALPGRTVTGVVRQIAAAASPQTGTYAVEVALEGADALPAGLVGRVSIAPRAAEPLPVIPIEAVLEADGDHAVVFALVDSGAGAPRARRMQVEVAFLRGDRVVVRRGLEGVRTVITDGAAYLEDGAAVKVTP